MLVGLFKRITGHRNAYRYALNATLILVACAIALNAYTGLQTRDAQHDTCHQVETLKTVIYRQVKASADLLGRRGTAGYAYYRAHPDELANARQQLTRELSAFGPQHCN